VSSFPQDAWLHPCLLRLKVKEELSLRESKATQHMDDWLAEVDVSAIILDLREEVCCLLKKLSGGLYFVAFE